MRYQFGEFILDLDTGELHQAQTAVPLRRQTLRLLQAMVEAAPSLLTRDQLLDEVWGRSAISPNALPQAISELRRALGDDAEAPRYIDTRRGLGYRFMAEVTVLDGPAPRPAPVPKSPGGGARAKPAVRVQIAALLVVLLIAIGIVWALRTPNAPNMAGDSNLPTISLALEPFPADANVAEWVPRAAFELFDQTLASERLVVYRSDTFGDNPAGNSADWQRQAHDLLGAAYSLSGRWQAKDDGRLTLNLTLNDLATGKPIVTSAFDGNYRDLDQLLAQAHTLIAQALHLAVTPNHTQGSPRLSALDREAYWTALAAMASGDDSIDDAKSAAIILSKLHASLGKPTWIEANLARALTQAQQRAAAQKLLTARLAQTAPLPIGERLRIQAQLAQLRHQPAEAAAAIRALVELYPQNLENWIQLIDAELDALQGGSARAAMAKLAQIASAQADPRLHLLRARLALVDNDFPKAQSEGQLAMQQAIRYSLPSIAIRAALAQADSLSQQGEVKSAAKGLAQADHDWSARASRSDRFALRMRQIKLLRVGGNLTTLPELLAQTQALAMSATEKAQWGIEQALLQSALGQHDQALETISALMPSFDGASDPALRITWHEAHAIIHLARNEVDLARQEFEAAFALARRMGQERFSAPLQVNAGMLLARERRFAEADTLWTNAMEVFAKLGDRRGQATCLGNLAASASAQNRPEQSRELNTKALALFREMGVTDAQARTAYNLALDAARFGGLAQAMQLFTEARSAWLAGAQLDLAIRAAVGEAEIHLLLAQPAAALAGLDTLPVDPSISALSRAAVRAARAKAVLAQGDLAQAKLLQEQALALRKEAGNDAWTRLSELELLRLDWLQGAESTRVQITAEALAQRFAALKEVRDTARAWLLVAEARLSLGQRTQALSALEQVQLGLRDFADRPLELDLAWVSAWAAPATERKIRLEALRKRAYDEDYLLTVAMIDAALSKTAKHTGDESLQVILPPYAKPD